jgi:hypothetical protein
MRNTTRSLQWSVPLVLGLSSIENHVSQLNTAEVVWCAAV